MSIYREIVITKDDNTEIVTKPLFYVRGRGCLKDCEVELASQTAAEEAKISKLAKWDTLSFGYRGDETNTESYLFVFLVGERPLSDAERDDKNAKEALGFQPKEPLSHLGIRYAVLEYITE